MGVNIYTGIAETGCETGDRKTGILLQCTWNFFTVALEILIREVWDSTLFS